MEIRCICEFCDRSAPHPDVGANEKSPLDPVSHQGDGGHLTPPVYQPRRTAPTDEAASAQVDGGGFFGSYRFGPNGDPGLAPVQATILLPARASRARSWLAARADDDFVLFRPPSTAPPELPRPAPTRPFAVRSERLPPPLGEVETVLRQAGEPSDWSGAPVCEPTKDQVETDRRLLPLRDESHPASGRLWSERRAPKIIALGLFIAVAILSATAAWQVTVRLGGGEADSDSTNLATLDQSSDDAVGAVALPSVSGTLDLGETAVAPAGAETFGATEAIDPGLVVNAGPSIPVNAGGGFVVWKLGEETTASVWFDSLTVAWLFDPTTPTWIAYIPALGEVDFPLVDGAVLWVVSPDSQLLGRAS